MWAKWCEPGLVDCSCSRSQQKALWLTIMSSKELKRTDRSTRAKRYQAALNDELEKDDADQSFWAQDFFAGECNHGSSVAWI